MLNTAASDAEYREGGRVSCTCPDFSIFHRSIGDHRCVLTAPRRAPAANNAPDAFPASAHRPSSPSLMSFRLFFARQRVHDGVISIGPDSGTRTYFEWHARPNRSRDSRRCHRMLPRDSQLSLSRKLSPTGPDASPRNIY